MSDLNHLRVALASGKGSFAPGETIHGTASWRLAEAPEGLEVRLFWYTAGKGQRDVGIVASQAIESNSREGRREFAFTTPKAPLSFSGRLISLIWAIELVRLPSGEAGRQEIVVSQTGDEIIIGTPASGELGSDEMEPD